MKRPREKRSYLPTLVLTMYVEDFHTEESSFLKKKKTER